MAEGSAAQIRQMVNFILQEAHEKANEIRIKVRHATRRLRPLPHDRKPAPHASGLYPGAWPTTRPWLPSYRLLLG